MIHGSKMVHMDDQEGEIYHRCLFLTDYHAENLKGKKQLIYYHFKESEKRAPIILPELIENL
ncbi:MAG: hypothetical protein ACTS77_01515 [Arsenophonus sp. NC-TX2-MAG3]